MTKINAVARLKASTAVEADADEFVRLSDQLTAILGKPERAPGCYSWSADIAGRDYDVTVKDKGRAMNVALGKDGEVKFNADVNTAETGIRAVEQGINHYVRHEALDAGSARQFLKRFSKPMVFRR